MSGNPSCQAESSGKWSFWKLAGIWTVGHLIASSAITLFSSELLHLFLPSATFSTGEMLVVSFFTPPIVTIWGIGVVALSYKCLMLCAVPTVTIVASYLVSAVFGFPLATFFSIGTLIITIYILMKNVNRRNHLHVDGKPPV